MANDAIIRELIDRVRRRWRTLRALQISARVALAAVAVLALWLAASRWTAGAPYRLAALALLTLVAIAAVVIRGFWPLRRAPDDRHVARFIEEREPSLDDRLASAVDAADRPGTTAGFVDAMLADAVRRLREIDLDAIVPADRLRHAGLQAGTAGLVLLGVLFVSRHVARQSLDAASFALFPSRIGLEVTPGNARVKAGAALTIGARLVGSTAPVGAQLQIADGEGWRSSEMTAGNPGTFQLAIDAVSATFRYRIAAGTIVSPIFEIVTVKPPRVARIDVDYTYPADLQLPSRTEKDGGDIYAPAGTTVRLHIVTDQPAASGRMTLGDGHAIDLAADGANQLAASLKVSEDGSYRVALTDHDGLARAGDTEYFIRMLEDRPPDVHVTRPAGDRSVTRLEEVDIEAQAEDDYGVDRLDLVYSVRGDKETVVPFKIARGGTTVNGRHTLFLEDLGVQPGDFVSYYVKARDITRGTRANEARSDIFFLEVKPYEQQFSLAQSQTAANGAGSHGSIDDLVAAQKEIIVATWKLDRRAQTTKGAKSEQDVAAVSKAESELKTRVEQASSGFRENAMRDPRRRTPTRGGRSTPLPGPELKAGQTLVEEDDMSAAASAMARAVQSLDALKTTDARAPEMEALTHLLKAQSDVKKREVSQRQAGGGNAANRSNYDLSTLFDKELQKQQQTNYETRSSAEQKSETSDSALDKIRELARRQDELLKRQRELSARNQSRSAEALKRELEKLTREQSELRQQAEELARQMSQGSQNQQNQQSQSQQQGQQRAQGSQGEQGQSGAQNGQSSGSKSGDAGKQMRDVSDAMRNATNELRRSTDGQPSQLASGARALDVLRQLERQMQSGQPDERRRAMGELQLEARQLADAQRDVASELGKTPSGDGGRDAMRRLAGEQERLADRARRLQDSLKQQNAGAAAAKDLEQQKLADRMRQSAEALRANAERQAGSANANDAAKNQIGVQRDLARSLDKAADRISAAMGTPKDGETSKVSEQLARAQQLQERLAQLNDEMQRASSSGRSGSPNASGRASAGDSTGSRGQGQGGGQSPNGAKSPGDTGRAGQGQAGGGNGSGADLAKLRDEAQRAMQETRELMEQMRRDDPSSSRGGAGFTFEGQGMTTSAPGTEAFKQDFAKWDDLRRQATQALESAQTTLSKKLRGKDAKERLSAGADDKAPPEYQKQVDDYFKAIAAKKKSG